MKNMYAVKCLYQSKFYTMDNEWLEDVQPYWEERIFLIKASSMEEADSKCEKIAKEYESDYINVFNQRVKVKLYTIIDIFATYDTDARTNIEVYSKVFEASEEDVEKMLDVEYPIEDNSSDENSIQIIEVPLTNIQQIDEAGILFIDTDGCSMNIPYYESYKSWCREAAIRKSKHNYICDIKETDEGQKKIIFYNNPQIIFCVNSDEEELLIDFEGRILKYGFGCCR